MSFHALERVYVRMLFDPAFADRVYADAAAALAGVDLDEGERAQLTAVDRRAWRHDPLRRYRTLRTLAEEFKASTTVALAATRSLAALDAFFSSPEFHAAVQGRASMAMAFSVFLGRLGVASPQFADVLRLETMLARCRRALRGARPAPEPPGAIDGGTVIELAPGHAVGRFNGRVVEAVNAAERYLFEVGLMPAVALCDDAPRLGEMPEVAAEPAYLMALPASSGVSLMPLDADYFEVLDVFSAGPHRLAGAVAAAVERGVARDDAPHMIASLLEEGVLVTTDAVGPRG